MSATALALPVVARPLRPARRSIAVVRPRCATARPVAPPRRPARTLRLTRRGRLVVTCTAATLLTGAVVAVTGALSSASAGVERTSAPPAAVLTVLPGQTLSQIAGQWSPGADWREVAGEIVQLNALPSMTLQTGQQLTMPEQG
ncbi:hypothetical protein [Kineococcus sp. R86509]|uniref:hypothetical protein n=1 Tax=Kineococcus sp. R86509 TaxID=3093851 RepID=UPI0036D2542D